uniref:Uncharacterized protein n=1 Tax=Cacopsylla melanoneura TaxID=428564 RepID=A0A8D9A5S9_9HEMI
MSSNELIGDEFKLNLVKKCSVKLPMKGERFRVKFADNFHVPHKLYLKNTDKVDKRKLNMMLAKKMHEPLITMPMSRLKEKGHVLIKFKKPAKLIRAQVKWIQSEINKIQVQDIDSGALYIVSHENIYVLDDENLASIYPRVFVCNLSEFDGKDIYWNSVIRDLYISTLRAGHLSIEIRTFHHTVLSYDVYLKLYFFDDKKFVNLNEWLANSFIPYLVFLKTRPGSVPQSVADYPTQVFFPYVKLLKDA